MSLPLGVMVPFVDGFGFRFGSHEFQFTTVPPAPCHVALSKRPQTAPAPQPRWEAFWRRFRGVFVLFSSFGAEAWYLPR